jgi:hypothetical protein
MDTPSLSATPPEAPPTAQGSPVAPGRVGGDQLLTFLTVGLSTLLLLIGAFLVARSSTRAIRTCVTAMAQQAAADGVRISATDTGLNLLSTSLGGLVARFKI